LDNAALSLAALLTANAKRFATLSLVIASPSRFAAWEMVAKKLLDGALVQNLQWQVVLSYPVSEMSNAV
jgi:hypothetical protein